MQTVPQPRIKAKFAHLYDEAVQIAKVNDVLYVFHADGMVEPFEVEMAPWTTILGDVATAECQAMFDRIHGGAARIACSRLSEVS